MWWISAKNACAPRRQETQRACRWAPNNAGLVQRPQWQPAHGSAGKQDDSIADGHGQSRRFPRTFPNPALADTVSCATLQACNGPFSVSGSPAMPITRMQVSGRRGEGVPGTLSPGDSTRRHNGLTLDRLLSRTPHILPRPRRLLGSPGGGCAPSMTQGGEALVHLPGPRATPMIQFPREAVYSTP